MTHEELAAQREGLKGTHILAGLCPNCGRTKKAEVLDETVSVGDRKMTDSATTHFCKICRDEFMADLRRGK